MSRATIEVTLELHVETARAYLLSDDGNKDNAEWLPKSLVSAVMPVKNRKNPDIASYHMPEWAAKDRGWI